MGHRRKQPHTTALYGASLSAARRAAHSNISARRSRPSSNDAVLGAGARRAATAPALWLRLVGPLPSAARACHDQREDAHMKIGAHVSTAGGIVTGVRPRGRDRRRVHADLRVGAAAVGHRAPRRRAGRRRSAHAMAGVGHRPGLHPRQVPDEPGQRRRQDLQDVREHAAQQPEHRRPHRRARRHLPHRQPQGPRASRPCSSRSATPPTRVLAETPEDALDDLRELRRAGRHDRLASSATWARSSAASTTRARRSASTPATPSPRATT